jgi:glycosyltransferase involved in cell wall biosynthesis
MKLNILHIAVHFGGGAGTVLNNWFKYDKSNHHTAILLNRNYGGEHIPYVYENFRNKYDEINEFVEKSDIVIVHFWNHPLLFEFLINSKLPKSRMCIWSHVSGLHPPYVHTENLINYPDKFIYSTPISGKNYIWTTGGINKYLDIKKNKNESEFRIGYVGTLDYSKLHPEFVEICSKIYQKIPNVKFIICGTGADEDRIKEKVSIFGLSESFEFKGMVNNIGEVMSTFDVFGYPLNETHFGTCEQVLGEAMACGIEPVVLNNPSEICIMEDLGRIAISKNNYIDNIVDVYKNPISEEESLRLKKRALELYDIDMMTNKWNNIFINIMEQEKKERNWNVKCETGSDIFIESLGEYGKILKNGNIRDIRKLFNTNKQWRSKSKGSVNQYLEAFPNDIKLIEWSKI